MRRFQETEVSMFYFEFCERLKTLLRKESDDDVRISFYKDSPSEAEPYNIADLTGDLHSYKGILLSREDALSTTLVDLNPGTLYTFCESNGWGTLRSALMQSLGKAGLSRETPHSIADFEALLPSSERLLFAALREYRASEASLLSVPAYRVFSNRALFELCQRRPKDKAELLTVPGIGEQKASQFGPEILSLIGRFAKHDF